MYTSVIDALTMDNVQKVLQNIDPEAYANAHTIDVYELTPQGTIDVIEFKY